MLTYTDLERRYDALYAERTNFESTWQQIANHIKGNRDFLEQTAKGQQRTRLIYDSTGMFSWDILASALQNFLINPETDWFGGEMEDRRLSDREEVIAWMDTMTMVLKALVERPEAGLIGQSNEFLSDYVGYGTSCMFVEDVPGLPIRFSHRPLNEIFIAENAAGIVDTVVRRYRLTNRAAVAEFGKKCLPRIAEKMEREPEAATEFMQFIHPATDPLYNQRVNRPWRLCVGSCDERAIVREKGLGENPALVARWTTMAGEVYGRGPGWTALPEQRMLNVMTQTLIEGAQLAIRPPLLVSDDDVINPLNLTPGGTTLRRSSSFAQDPITLLETSGDHRLAVEMFDRRRAAVRSAFMHDLLEILQAPVTTATQVLEMVARARTLFAPTVGRLQTEFLDPLLKRAFQIGMRANAFPPPPSALRGQNIRVVYRNPVSRSQKASDSQAVDEFTAFVANLAGVDPGVLDNVNFDELARLKHRIVGVSPTILRSRKDVDERRAMQAEMAEKQQQEQGALAAMEAAGKAAPMLQVLQGGKTA